MQLAERMRALVRVQLIAPFGLLIGCVGHKQVLVVRNKNAVDAQFGQQVALYNAACENHILIKRLESACVFINEVQLGRVT